MAENKDYSKLYLGYDESNNGAYPEVDVVVRSKLEKDLDERKLSKKKRNLKAPRLGPKRDFSFLLFEEINKKEIAPKERLGCVIASLLVKDISPKYKGELEIYVDGEWAPNKLIYTKDHVADLLQIHRGQVSVYDGKDLDKTIPLVNFADYIARWIFKYWTPERIANSDKKRNLIK